MIFSFDVFDTTITRTLAKPKDVQHLVQKKIESLILPIELIRNFPALRQQSELLARISKKKEDTNLDDVYLKLSQILKIPLNISNQIKEIELEIEKEISRPIAKSLQQITKARLHGNRIIFISDTIIPKSTIQKLLINVQAFKENDGLYVSSDIGLIKRSGNLFKYVLEKERSTSKNIVHHGDNLISDFIIPNYFLGIKSHYLCH